MNLKIHCWVMRQFHLTAMPYIKPYEMQQKEALMTKNYTGQ